jgi:FtsH-binding integral membrane protein
MSQPYEDPGWLPVLRRVGRRIVRRPREDELDGVMILRLVFLTMLLAPLLILLLLTLVVDGVGEPSPALSLLVLVLGLAGLAGAYWTANHKLDVGSAHGLAESYRKTFFLGFSLNEMPLLVSFVFALTREELWPYLVGLALFFVGMALIAPSRRNLERRQQTVQSQGSTLSLRHALSDGLWPGEAGT